MEAIDKSCIPSPYELDQLRPFYPKERGVKRLDDVSFFTAIRMHLKHGLPWRMIPKELGNWKTIYSRFTRWFRHDGPLGEAFSDIALRKANFSSVMLDSTCCKCARTASSFYVKNKRRHIGQTKGGYNTKIHVLCDAHGYPFDFTTTQGQISDIKTADYFVETLKCLPYKRWFLADKGYDSQKWRLKCHHLGVRPCIPYRHYGKGKSESTKAKLDERRKHDPWEAQRNKHNQKLYKTRNRVERGIGRLKDIDHVAFRKCRSAIVFEAVISLTLLFHFWLKI